jgi:hypothetical protein
MDKGIQMNLKPLLYFINERHRIYLKRIAGEPAPWTSDPILQQYRFCNVFRELDTATIWLRKNWREPYADHPQLWFWLLAARIFNVIPTFELLGLLAPDRWNVKLVKTMLHMEHKKGNKVFTSAYMIHPPKHGGSKIDYYVDILETAWQKRDEFQRGLTDATLGIGPIPTLQNVATWLRQFQSIGGFVSYEVVTDLTHTPLLCNAPDLNTWAHAGVGAVRGLNRLLGLRTKQAIQQHKAIEHMVQLLPIVNAARGSHVPELTLRDLEHSLCETDKYLRTKTGEGRPRENFTGNRSS